MTAIHDLGDIGDASATNDGDGIERTLNHDGIVMDYHIHDRRDVFSFQLREQPGHIGRAQERARITYPPDDLIQVVTMVFEDRPCGVVAGGAPTDTQTKRFRNRRMPCRCCI